MEFRARFAPSPTGQVHIGNIRTAIFNWLYTRHVKGTFLLRIEDTDLERSTQQAIDALMDCMKWLGLDYDEEPMYQTKQAGKHLAAAKKLTEAGNAYKADPAVEASPLYFRIPYDCSNFAFVRSMGKAEVKLAPGTEVTVSRAGLTYKTLSAKGKEVETQACLAGFYGLEIEDEQGTKVYCLTEENVRKALTEVEPTVVKGGSKLVFERREVFYHDLVKGDLAKPLDSMRDFIIVRSDGSPVFHLANVWDDIEQRVTHIVRGDDHVENTYRHLFLFACLGYPPPSYAHLPMIVNAQGKPYSKRDGDAFVGDFKEKGYLPEALFNYLTLLGWSPGDDREKMSKEELVEAFHIERVQHTPAQFDMAKLAHMNGMYLAELPTEKFTAMARDFAGRYAWSKEADKEMFDRVSQLMQSRTKILTDTDQWQYFFTENFAYDAKGMKKFMSDATVREALGSLKVKLAAGDLNAQGIEEAIRASEQEYGIKEGKMNQPLRVAITGTTIGAGVYEIAELLGSKRAAQRIERALAEAIN